MPSTHSLVRMIAGAAVLLGLAGRPLVAQVAVDDKSRCGTPISVSPPPAHSPGRPAPGPGAVATPGAGFPISGILPPMGEVVAVGGGGSGTSGSAPTSPAAPTSPQAPGGAAPPAVPPLPGLPPPSGEEEERGHRVEAIQAKGEIPEEKLLDLGVQIFDAGVEEADRDELARRGLSPELRRSESRYVAFHLKKTLEGTGNWGAVRMLPGPGEGLDVFLSGRILESNGKRLALEVEAADSTGRRWLRRKYKDEADQSAYRPDRVGRYDAFQELYNRIANDLLEARDGLDAEELVEVRQVSSLRFAAALAPEAFSDYLEPRGSGRFELLRLPAADDPMTRRLASIRERDQMFVDTLNEHYLGFYDRMSGPYATWRMYSFQEQDALDRINRESLLKKILGGAAVIAGMMMDGRSQGRRVAGDLAVIGGMAAIQSGFRQAQEKGLHTAALKELAMSFDGEVAPLLVEVEGHQLKLTGSAEAQFVAWRELLGQVFAVETGLPGDPNAVIVTAAPPPY